MYLCMDACGLLYGSRDASAECVFREKINEDNYNTYSSSRHSNANRTLYVAMNRWGQPRKLALRAGADLGKLASYARALTTAPGPDVHGIRHEAHHCRPTNPATSPTAPSSPRRSSRFCAPGPKKKPRKKKKKRKCTRENPCNKLGKKKKDAIAAKKKMNECDEDCSEGKSKGKKKGGGGGGGGGVKKNGGAKGKGKKGRMTTTTTTTTTMVTMTSYTSTTTENPIDGVDDDYYGFENSTQLEWDSDSSSASTTTTRSSD